MQGLHAMPRARRGDRIAVKSVRHSMKLCEMIGRIEDGNVVRSLKKMQTFALVKGSVEQVLFLVHSSRRERKAVYTYDDSA